MKKTLILAAIIGLAFVASPRAMTPVYNDYLVNESALAYNTSYYLDLDTLGTSPYGIDFVSFQANYGTATVASQTYDDGQVSTGSIVILSTSNYAAVGATNSITIGTTASLAATQATNTLTVSSNSALAGAILTVNGTMLIEGRDWTKQSTASGTAVALSVLLNGFPGLDCSTTTTVLIATPTVVATGLVGNSFTMKSSTPAALTVGSLNFTGGAEQALTNAVITINGQAWRNGYGWRSADTSSMTAVSIAALMNTYSIFRATVSGPGSRVVVATAALTGVAGNAYTLVSSTQAAMTVASANFTGGRSTASITINGVTLVRGVDWTEVSTASGTAKAISDAIVANSSLSPLILSTWTLQGTVPSTSVVTGAGTTYTWSSNISSITMSNGRLYGGITADFVFQGSSINVPSHGFTTALPVLFSTGTGNGAGLVNQTTYYVSVINANTIRLSSTSAVAQTGVGLTFTSTSTTGPHTYTLAPLAFTGNASFKWQVSNDGSNWVDFSTTPFNVSVATVTFSSPYAPASTYWDFNQITPRYIRLNVVAPTTGGLNLRVKGNGKRLP